MRFDSDMVDDWLRFRGYDDVADWAHHQGYWLDRGFGDRLLWRDPDDREVDDIYHDALTAVLDDREYFS